MNIDLNSLKIFYYVVELKGFTKAASFLGLSKSQISKKIAYLESAYEVKLLNRTQHHFELTPAGQALLPYCQQIVSASDNAYERLMNIRQSISGHVRISSPQLIAELLSQDFIPDFSQQYPDIVVDLQVGGRPVDLIKEHYDISFRSTRVPADPNYIQRYFIQCRFVLCANPAYLKAHGKPANVQTLSQHRCGIFASNLASEYTWPFIKDEKEFSVPVYPAYVSNQWTTLKNYGENEPVLLHLPRYVAEPAVKAGKLVEIELDYPVAHANLNMLYLQKDLMPRHLRLFIDSLLAWSQARGQVF